MTGRAQLFGPFGWCVAAALLFGASTPAAKLLVDAAGPVFLAGLLYAGAALGVLPLAARDWRVHRSPSSKSLWRLVGAILFGAIVGPVLVLWGLSLAPAGSVSLWLTLETVATAFLARLLFREHLGPRGWTAVLLVVAGSALLAERLDLSGAALLVGLACIAWGLDNNLTSVIDGFTPAQVTFWKGAAAAATLLPIGFLLGQEATLVQALAALGIGAVGYGLSLVCYVSGAQQLGATRSQLVFSTSPLLGLGVAWLALGEAVGWWHGLAGLLMAVAIVLLYFELHEHDHAHEAVEHTHPHRHDDGHHGHDHPEGASTDGWHQHSHRHEPRAHRHPHRPDLHHRHDHD